MKTDKPKKIAMDLEQCVALAKEIIEEQGVCLLAFDIIGSQTDSPRLAFAGWDMADHLSNLFARYMPHNTLANMVDVQKGFRTVGDLGYAGINHPDAVREIIKYCTFAYPEIPLRWGVGLDGWDRNIKQL